MSSLNPLKNNLNNDNQLLRDEVTKNGVPIYSASLHNSEHYSIYLDQSGYICFTGESLLGCKFENEQSFGRVEGVSNIQKIDMVHRVAIALDKDGKVFSAALPSATSSGREGQADGFKRIRKS